MMNFGAVTVAWRLGMTYALPDNPIEARFLLDQKCIFAVERMGPG